MLTAKVASMLFLLNQRFDVSNHVVVLVNQMSREELRTVRYYEEHGTLIEVN